MEHIYKLYSTLPELERRKTWAEIDLSALRGNYRILREMTAGSRLIAVVKAEAYGHGAPECVRALLAEGCDFFAVSCIDEAMAVRAVCDAEQKNADVLILGYTQPSMAGQLARCNIIQALLSEDFAAELNNAAAATGETAGRGSRQANTSRVKSVRRSRGGPDIPQRIPSLVRDCSSGP